MIEPEDSYAPIITRSAKEILKSGRYNDVPVIIGYNAEEAIIMNADNLLKSMEEWQFENFLPYLMALDRNSELAKQLGMKIKHEYLEEIEDIRTGVYRVSFISVLV